MSIISLALEAHDKHDLDDEVEDKVIVMSGPLSEVIYRSLNIVYAKDTNKNDNLSIESLAQEVVVSQKLLENISNNDTSHRTDYIVFGVAKQEAEAESIIEVKNILDNKDKETELIVLVQDPSSTNSKDSDLGVKEDITSYHENISEALESFMKSKGIKVVHSLEALIEYLD